MAGTHAEQRPPILDAEPACDSAPAARRRPNGVGWRRLPANALAAYVEPPASTSKRPDQRCPLVGARRPLEHRHNGEHAGHILDGLMVGDEAQLGSIYRDCQVARFKVE